MSDCYLHDFPGRIIALRYLCETGEAQDLLWAAEALNAVDELRTVVDPLSAALQLGCRDKNRYRQDWDVAPPYPTWFIRESSVPEGIIIKQGVVNPQLSQAPKLTREILTAWIENAFQQQCPCIDTHDVAWYDLYFDAVRARIYNEKNFEERSTFVIKKSQGKFEIPILKENNDLWVYSPVESLRTEPSIKYIIGNEEGALSLRISVHWSWWTETSPEDKNALQQAILRIIALGWKLEYCHEVFGLSA